MGCYGCCRQCSNALVWEWDGLVMLGLFSWVDNLQVTDRVVSVGVKRNGVGRISDS